MVVRPRTGSTRRYRKLRKYIIARDGNRCQKCGSQKSIQAHHVVPLSAGGWTPLEIFALFVKNAMTLCTAKPGADRLKKGSQAALCCIFSGSGMS